MVQLYFFHRYGNYGHGHMDRKRKPDNYDRRFAKESRSQDPREARGHPGMDTVSPLVDPHEYH